MPQSYIEYNSGLTGTTFSVPFKYISVDDVHALGYDGTYYSSLAVASRDASAKTITLAAAPSAYTKVRVYRSTATEQLVDFQNGSRLSEADLDTAYQQGLFVAQEVSEDANTNQYVNLADAALLANTSLSEFSSSSHTGDGTEVTFDLSFVPKTSLPQAFLVIIDGVLQSPVDAYTMSINPAQITFASVPPASSKIVVTTTAAGTGAVIENLDVKATGSTEPRSLSDRFADTVNVKDFGAVGDGVTDDTAALRSARDYAETNTVALYWSHGTYLTTGSIDRIHTIQHVGQGVIKRGSDIFYLGREGDTGNTLYVSVSGNDNRDGLTSNEPLKTIQKAFDVWSNYARNSHANWTVSVASGTYTEGAQASGVISPTELVVDGGNKASTIIDGSTATKTSGLNFNAMSTARVKNVTVQNFSSSGIAFQNGTRGVVDTCNASGNGFADFNASEDAELVVRGVNNIGNGSRYGIRVYRNSGASIGDGTNLVNIDGATEAGIQSRDGSKVVCDNNVTINDCDTGVRLIKDGYVELRDSNITNNTDSGIFADSNSQYDNQTGTVNFSGNFVDKKFLGFSVDRSILNVAGVTPVYIPMYNSNTSGVSPSSTYDIVLDGSRNSGIQVLGGGNLNLDANKTERLTLNTSDNSLRIILNASEEYRAYANQFRAADDATKDLGSSSYRWKNTYTEKLYVGEGLTFITSGSGNPQGSVTAPVGSLYTRTDGGASTTLYVKETGTGNTGWVAK